MSNAEFTGFAITGSAYIFALLVKNAPKLAGSIIITGLVIYFTGPVIRTVVSLVRQYNSCERINVNYYGRRKHV